MIRIQCIVQYDGSKFYGFQIQPGMRSIQGCIQDALKKICKEDIIIHASGRTDALVHGIGQVFHFDTTSTIEISKWKRAMNHFLPEDIYIKSVRIVEKDFHSRYNAISKEYHYKLSTNEYDVFQKEYIYQYGRALNIDAMKEAATIFVGEHDFASFCSYDQYGNTIRTIYSFIIEEEDGYVCFKIRGNGFRRYMVRHLVGGLIQVGSGRMTLQELLLLLQSKGEKKCLHKAKPQGLYLYKVCYMEDEL